MVYLGVVVTLVRVLIVRVGGFIMEGQAGRGRKGGLVKSPPNWV